MPKKNPPVKMPTVRLPKLIEKHIAKVEKQVNDPPKWSPDAINTKAAKNLEAELLRIQRSAQRDYDALKALEVKRLAEETGAQRPLIVDITGEEEVKVKP